MPQPSQKSILGVAKDTARSQTAAAVAAAAVSVPLVSATGFTASSTITIYDGPLTETRTATALSGSTLTVPALTNAHGVGCLVEVTAALDVPTAFVPVTTFTPNDNRTMLEDKGFRGSAVDVYGLVIGAVFGSYSTGGDVFADTIGWFLGSMLGDVVTTGGSAPFTHTMAALNSGNFQPKPLTLTDYDGIQARAFPGQTVTDLSFTFNADGLLAWTASVQGYASGTVATPTAAFSGVQPVAGWTGSTTIGGVYTPTLMSGTIDMKRKGTIIPSMDGNPNPYAPWVGPLSVTGKLTFIAEDETQLVNYLNNTQPSLVLDFLNGAGAALTEIKFQMTKCAYSAATKNRGQDYSTIEVTYTAVANTTDAGASAGMSPIKVVLQNAVASGTYQ